MSKYSGDVDNAKLLSQSNKPFYQPTVIPSSFLLPFRRALIDYISSVPHSIAIVYTYTYYSVPATAYLYLPTLC